MDADANNDNNNEKIKKNRRPTLQELGFGEQVPRKTKVDKWLNQRGEKSICMNYERMFALNIIKLQ